MLRNLGFSTGVAILIGILILGLLIYAGSGWFFSGEPFIDPDEPICGNTVCETGENYFTCLLDCFACNENGECEAEIGENYNSCRKDCPVPMCNNNGKCDPKENASNCPMDCKIESGPCIKDGFCNARIGETIASCSDDCNVTRPFCGDRNCSRNESCSACPSDCGACPPNPVCGNNRKEGTEACDGSDLAGQSCQSKGFLSGSLSCVSSCADFNVSGCVSNPSPVCGNNIREGNEKCDGSDLNNQTCASRGFQSGSLSCLSNCSDFNASLCASLSMPVCGDNVKEGGEKCDGWDLDSRTCQTEGFVSGLLSCGSNCQDFNISNCSMQAALVPIARWDVVPFQRINPGETLNLGVVAFSIPGIQKVEFAVSGQGYSGGTKTATSMTLNPQTGVWEYWVSLSVSEFSSDGVISVEAKVVGKDGGIRDQSTGGGNLGLDALIFVVNPKGTLPQAQAWVDLAGNDSTGAVNDSAKPFKTIGRAIDSIRKWRLAAGNGNNADSGIVRLNPGIHSMSKGGIAGEIPVTNEWVTVTTAVSGAKDTTILSHGNGGTPEVRLLKVTGLTLKSTGTNDFAVYVAHVPNAQVWVDDSNLVGPGRFVQAGYLVVNPAYYTNSTFFAVDYAVSGAKLARNVKIDRIGADAFRQTALIINSQADDLNPNIADLTNATYTAYGHPSDHNFVIEKTGAFRDYNWASRDRVYTGSSWSMDNCKVGGKISEDAIRILPNDCSNGRGRVWNQSDGPINATLWTEDHSDGLQWWGPGSGSPCSIGDNVIVYNNRITNARYQVMWTDGFETCPQSTGAAFVNNYFRKSYMNPNNYGNLFSWAIPTSQLVWWNNTFDSDLIWIRNLPMGRTSGMGNLFLGPLIDLGHLDFNKWANNAYAFTDNVPSGGGPTITPGIPNFIGDPGIDSFGRPIGTSVLRDRIASPLLPVDQSGSTRGSVSDVGAYEYVP